MQAWISVDFFWVCFCSFFLHFSPPFYERRFSSQHQHHFCVATLVPQWEGEHRGVNGVAGRDALVFRAPHKAGSFAAVSAALRHSTRSTFGCCGLRGLSGVPAMLLPPSPSLPARTIVSKHVLVRVKSSFFSLLLGIKCPLLDFLPLKSQQFSTIPH